MIEVLVSTMHQKNTDLIEKMNLQSDAIIINQTDVHDYQQCTRGEHRIKFYSFAERGVGLSRNCALMRATADICILADDDMVFEDGYCATVQQVFDENPSADVVIFNLIEKDSVRRVNDKVKKIHKLNYMNYGAARVAFRRKGVSYHGICFNQNFGGGTQHQCGEDTLFLRDCLDAGLNMIAVPVAIATLHDDRPSTWFHGYDKKYLFDKGVVLAIAHPVLAPLFCLYLALRHKEYAGETMTRFGVLKEMCRGIRFVKRKEYYDTKD